MQTSPTGVLVLNHDEVYQLLTMDECMELMAQALKALARGRALNPLRHGLWLPQRTGVLGMMPAYLEEEGALGLKAITVFPGNEDAGYDSHQGAVLLFEAEHGCLLAIVDAGAVTAIRTAAVSGVATRVLAREDAGNLALLGSGVQAATHLQAMLRARSLRRVRVWSRNESHARLFAEQQSKRLNIEVEPVRAARDAVLDADLICTVTAAREPVLMGEWLSPGTHINAVGSSTPFARELDTAAVVRSRLFVDRRESAIHEAGDFLIPKKEGAVDDDHIQGEIGDVLVGRIPGRESEEEITLFKSLGLAVEDVAAAHYVYHAARKEKGIGTTLELGRGDPQVRRAPASAG